MISFRPTLHHAPMIVLAALTLAAPCGAQPGDPDQRAVAEALYEEAVAALDRKDYKAACPMLEEVVRLWPLGVGAKHTLAECYHEEGRLATAWRAYLTAAEAARVAGQLDREMRARARAQELEKQLAIPGAGMTNSLPIGGPPAIEEAGASLAGGATLPADARGGAERLPPRSKPELSHRGQFGAIGRLDVEGQGRGVAAALGLSYGIGDRVEIGLWSILGRNKAVEPALSVFLCDGAFKPLLGLGLPIFFAGGAYPGVRPAAGVIWDPSRHFGLSLQAAMTWFPGVPEGYEHVSFVPAIGVHSRL